MLIGGNMIELKTNDQSLSICLDGKDKLTFNVGDKIFAIGRGKNWYSMSRGSFNIKEKITEKYLKKIQGFEKDKTSTYILFNEGKLKLDIVNNNIYFTPEGFDSYNFMWLMLPSNADEGFYGTGEVFTEFNLKGEKANIWVAEHINVKQTTIKMLNKYVNLN